MKTITELSDCHLAPIRYGYVSMTTGLEVSPLAAARGFANAPDADRTKDPICSQCHKKCNVVNGEDIL